MGQAALDRMATHPEETVTSFKRMMGTASTVTLAGTTLTPEDLSAMVLRSLADDVEAASGERPTAAVITVPAYFNERQRRATRRAGEIAGEVKDGGRMMVLLPIDRAYALMPDG